MAHVDQQVRDVFKTRFETVAALESVHTNRGEDLRDEHLPAAMIETGEDEVSRESKAWEGDAPLQKRMIEVSTVLVVAGSTMDAVDDEMDAIRAAMEAAIAADEDLGGLAQDVFYKGSSLFIGADEDGANWYAFRTMRWEVVVWTHHGDPETSAS